MMGEFFLGFVVGWGAAFTVFCWVMKNQSQVAEQVTPLQPKIRSWKPLDHVAVRKSMTVDHKNEMERRSS